MTSGDVLPPAILQPAILQCWAVVYVRQSTQSQIETNTEGRRRQYELVEVARRRGFRAVEVIDEDLGRSASGMVARPGFEKLVAALCAITRSLARSAPCSASMLPGSRATAVIGITYSSSAAWSRPG